MFYRACLREQKKKERLGLLIFILFVIAFSIYTTTKFIGEQFHIKILEDTLG